MGKESADFLLNIEHFYRIKLLLSFILLTSASKNENKLFFESVKLTLVNLRADLRLAENMAHPMVGKSIRIESIEEWRLFYSSALGSMLSD